MWSGPLHDKDFVKAVLQHIDECADKYGTSTRMKGMLTVACEVGVEPKSSSLVNLFTSRNWMCRSTSHRRKLPACSIVSARLWTRWRKCVLDSVCHFSNNPCSSALLNGGYKISRSHASPGSLKTDAPRSFIHDVMRGWVKKHPVKMQNIKEGQVAHRLLAKELR